MQKVAFREDSEFVLESLENEPLMSPWIVGRLGPSHVDCTRLAIVQIRIPDRGVATHHMRLGVVAENSAILEKKSIGSGKIGFYILL